MLGIAQHQLESVFAGRKLDTCLGLTRSEMKMVDANPIFDPMMLRHRCVASNHVLLDDDAAPHSFDRAVENRNKSVASGFDEPSVMPHNAGLYQLTLDPLHAKMRSFLIDLHEAAVARNIAGDDCSKPARR